MLVEGEGPRSVVKEIEPMYVNLCDPVWGSQPLSALIPSSFLLYVHVWCMYVCMRGICVYIRMCARRGPDNFRCYSRGTTYILFRQCLPLAWNLLSRLNCLARKSQGSAYLYLPSAGITSTGSHQLFLFWGLNSCPSVCKSSTLPTEPPPFKEAVCSCLAKHPRYNRAVVFVK